MSDLIEMLNGWADDLRKSGEVAMRRPDREGASPRVAGLASRADLLKQAADELTRLRSLVDQSGGGGLETYDAGLLSDYGGGDVSWWQDYLRAELARAHDFYADQFAASPPHGGRILEGWRIVPVEPTREMMTAGMVAEAPPYEGATNSLDRHALLAKSIYQAMLSAAPVSPLREGNGASRDQSLSSSAACVADATTLVPGEEKTQ